MYRVHIAWGVAVSHQSSKNVMLITLKREGVDELFFVQEKKGEVGRRSTATNFNLSAV